MRVFCYSCGDDTLVNSHGECSWCTDRITTPATPSRYVLGRKAYIATEDFYRDAHTEYLVCRSIPAVAATRWKQAGYASQKSCTNSLWSAFRARGWPVYTRAYANTKHGLARNGHVDAAYKRRKRIERGETRGVACAAMTVRGDACRGFAMRGSSYCHAHNPDTRAGLVARLDQARARSIEATRARHQRRHAA